MATAEFAVAVPAVVGVMVLGAAGLSTLVAQVECVDAARATARLVARGDDPSVAVAQGQQLAPRGARIIVGEAGGAVTVSVIGRPALPLAWAGAVAVPRADAVAAREDDHGSAG